MATNTTKSTLDNVQRFVESHPGFFAGRSDHAVVVQIEAVDRNGDRWTEFMSVWSIAGARHVLGY